MNKKYQFFLLLLIGALNLNAQPACLDFEEFPVGPAFGPILNNMPGDTLFGQEGLLAIAQEIQYPNGNTGFGNALIEGSNVQWLNGQFLFMGNNALELHYPDGVQQVCFDFFDGGGVENLAVNGSAVAVLDGFTEAADLNFPGVDISVVLDSTGTAVLARGTICITGEIYSLRVGGQEFGVDNVCATAFDEPDTGDCLEFEAMDNIGYGAEIGTPPGTVFYTETGVDLRLAPVQTLFWASIYGDLLIRQESSLPSFARASGQFLEFASINSIYDLTAYPEPVEKITVDYYYAPDGDGTINFAANGTPFLIQFMLQPGFYALAPGVTLEVVPDNNINSSGQLVFEGNVQSLLIGGVSGLHIDNVCINPPPPCPIQNFTVAAGDCNPNGVFEVVIDIEYNGLPSDTLKLFTNGNYQLYAAGEFPVTLSPFTAPTDTILFEVSAFGQPDCGLTAVLLPKDCTPDCTLEALEIVNEPLCEPGDEVYTIGLQVVGAEAGDTLVVQTQNTNISTVVIYNGQQLVLDMPLPTEQFEALQICDYNNSDCCVEISYDIGCPSCAFENLAINPLPCDGDSLFYFKLNFDALGSLPSNSFKVQTSNGFLETYSYTDLPVTVGPVLGYGEAITVWVFDTESDCGASTTIITPDCSGGCVLGDVNLLTPAAGCNDDGTYNIPMTIENAQNGDLFTITSLETGFSQTLAYGMGIGLNLQLSDWPAPGLGVESLSICFADQPNCCTSISFEVPCDPVDCGLSAQVEVIECQPNGVLFLAVTTTSNTPNVGPFVMINIGDFQYGLFGINTTVEVGPVINPGASELTVTVQQWGSQSSNSVLCEVEVPVDVSDCSPDCDIPDFEVIPEGCTGIFGNYSVFIDLDEAALNGTPVDIYVNGDLRISNYSNGDITLEVMALNPGDVEDVISVCYTNNPECCISKGIDALPCYCTDILEIVAEATPCDGGSYYIKLDLVTADFGDLFYLEVNNEFYGSYAFNELPVTIGPFEGNGQPLELFAYQEGQCQPASTTIEAPVCNGGCALDGAALLESECFGNTYQALFQLQGQIAPGDTIVVASQVTNFTSVGTLSPTGNGIFDVLLPTPGEGFDVVTICLGNQPNCCVVVDYELPCSNQGCDLQAVLTEATDCNDEGEYSLVLDIEYTGVPTSFEVSIPALNFSAVYGLNDFPVAIPGLPGDGETYQVNVGATDCNAFKEKLFEAPACNIGCIFNNVIAEPHPCEDGAFLVDIEVQASDPGDLGYFIFADGEIFGPYDYSEPFVTLGPFAGDGVTVYDFLILDFANPTCFGYVEVGPKSCDDENDCQILELSAIPQDCNDDGTYDLLVDIEVEEPQNDLLFWFYLNGELIAQSTLAALPGELINIPLGNAEEVAFKACIFDEPDCCKEVVYAQPDCPGNECLIEDVVAEFAFCDEDGFYVDLDFVTGGQPENGLYKVFGNGDTYGTLSYGAPRPITVGPFDPFTDNIYELIVEDLSGEGCSGFTEFVAFDCPPDTSSCVDFEPFAGFQSPPADGTGDLQEIGIQAGVFLGYSLGDFCLCSVEVTDSENLNFFDAAEGQVVAFSDAELYFEFSEAAAEVSFDYSVQETDIYLTESNFNVLILLDTLSENTPVTLPNGNMIERIPYPQSNDFMESSRIIISGEVTVLKLLGSGFVDNLCWAPATQEVWPGDANADNLAHHVDLLSIGLSFGATGPVRVNPDNSWSPAVAMDWDSTFANGTNYKHADCNGDGVINESDRAVIVDNYGLAHGTPQPITELPGTDIDPPAFIEFPTDQPDGATFQAPIIIGAADVPVQDAYGVAFTVQFDPEVIDPNQVEVVYPTSWFGEPGINTLAVDKVYPDGRIEIALTRIDQNNVSGHGQVAYIIGIIDDIAGLTSSEVSVERILCIDMDEDRLPIQGRETTFKVVSSNEPDAGNGVFTLFPNPATDWVNIVSPHGFTADQVQLLNMSGQVLPAQIEDNRRVSLANLPAGIYVVRITTGPTIVHKRVVKE